MLSNYQGVRRCHLILVFDAYKVKGGTGSIEQRGGIHIVYTKEAETADMYIEQASYDLSHKHRVRVATSDGMEQMIILAMARSVFPQPSCTGKWSRPMSILRQF